jgi:hypothetical protein
MRLALGAFAYLCGVAALVAAAYAGFQIMTPADRGTVATASSAPPPPRSEPKRVEAIRPVNEPVQTPTPKYEVSGVPISATAAYNKKKAKEQYGQRSTQRKHRPPKISDEAANAYGSAAGYVPPPRPRDWTIY